MLTNLKKMNVKVIRVILIVLQSKTLQKRPGKTNVTKKQRIELLKIFINLLLSIKIPLIRLISITYLKIKILLQSEIDF